MLDFGLAKLAPLGPERADAHTTHAVVRTDAGTAVGTVDYMSPEQARGQPVDARTDVWSLGVLLYELVAGRRPFAGQSSSEVLAGILEHEPAPLARFEPDAPAELQRIVGKALRKDREQRYQVMKDLLLDLQALRDEVAGQARAAASSNSVPDHGNAHAARLRPRCHAAVAVQRGVRRHAAGQTQGRCGARRVRPGVDRWRLVVGGPTSSQSGQSLARSTAPVQRTLTRLTFGPGLQTDVTWSPDGRFIAYASDKAGNFDIWVQPVGGGDPVQVTRSPAQDTQPDWSPDGSTLVFRSERDGGGLFLVPALGGVERQLTSFGSYPSWSPNGSEILFADVLIWVSATSERGSTPCRRRRRTARDPGGLLRAAVTGPGSRAIPDGRISALGLHRQARSRVLHDGA